MKSQFTAVYKKHGKWYLGWVEEIPGVNTQGRTLKSARRNLKDALKLVLDSNRDITKKLFEKELGDHLKREKLIVPAH